MKIVLHKAAYPYEEISVESDEISNMRWLTVAGGTILSLGAYGAKEIEVDENCNYIGLLCGFIEGRHCGTGSASGIRNFYYDHPEYLKNFPT